MLQEYERINKYGYRSMLSLLVLNISILMSVLLYAVIYIYISMPMTRIQLQKIVLYSSYSSMNLMCFFCETLQKLPYVYTLHYRFIDIKSCYGIFTKATVCIHTTLLFYRYKVMLLHIYKSYRM